MSSTKKLVVDSSAWIELLKRGKFADACAREIDRHVEEQVIVSTIVLFEVYRKIKKDIGKSTAMSACSYLKKYQVRDVTSEIALLAGDLAIEHKLPMADSLVYAYSVFEECTFLTLDYDNAKLKYVLNPRHN